MCHLPFEREGAFFSFLNLNFLNINKNGSPPFKGGVDRFSETGWYCVTGINLFSSKYSKRTSTFLKPTFFWRNLFRRKLYWKPVGLKEWYSRTSFSGDTRFYTAMEPFSHIRDVPPSL